MSGKPVAVRYKVEFTVLHHPGEHLEQYEAALQRVMQPLEADSPTGPGASEHYSVEASALEGTLDRIYKAVFGTASGHGSYIPTTSRSAAHTILLINPSKARIAAQLRSPMGTAVSLDGFTYSHMYNGVGRAQSWVGSGRYAVVDLAAGPAWYGAKNDIQGAVAPGSFPRLDMGHRLSPGEEANAVGLLSSIVADGVRHLFSPDIDCQVAHQWENHVGNPAKKSTIYIPIIVFRNHRQFDPLDKSSKDFFIDISAIREAVSKLELPGARLKVVVESTQELRDFPDISRSLARSIREDTRREPSQSRSGSGRSGDGLHYVMRMRPYLDSAVLRSEFNHSLHFLDSLAPDFIQHNPKLWHFIHPAIPEGSSDIELEGYIASQGGDMRREGVGGTLKDSHHVFPVYVFSLLGLQREILIDQKDITSVGSEGIIVLQTGSHEVEVPYFDQGRPVTMNARRTTPHIIGGIAMSLAGIVPPNMRANPGGAMGGGAPVESHLWSVGAHPWGVFTHSLTISALSLDMGLRNLILRRLDAAQREVWKHVRLLDQFAQEYLYDPFAATGSSQDAAGAADIDDVVGMGIGFMSNAGGGGGSASVFPVEKVNRIADAMSQIQDALHRIASLLGERDYSEAYERSAGVLQAAREFGEETRRELGEEGRNLSCCEVEHRVSRAIDYWALSYVIAAVLAVYGGVLRWAKAGSDRGRKQ